MCVCMCSFLRGLILVNVVLFFFCWLLLMLLIFQYLQPTFKNHNFPIRMREETIYVFVKYRVEGKNPKLFDNWGQKKGWKISQESHLVLSFLFFGCYNFPQTSFGSWFMIKVLYYIYVCMIVILWGSYNNFSSVASRYK